MNPAAHDWIEGLPRRWAIGGVVAGLIWIAVGATLGWSRPSVVGLAILTGIIFVPFALLGFAWGWNERLALREAAADGDEGVERVLAGEYHFTQTGKGAACGVAHGLFFVAMQTAGVIPGDGELIFAILGPATVGGGIGLIVGNVARFNLRRRLKRAPAVADASSRPSRYPETPT